MKSTAGPQVRAPLASASNSFVEGASDAGPAPGPRGRHPLSVVKLGGSLLTRPGLVDELRSRLLGRPDATQLVIVGGGPIVDAVRAIDKVNPDEPRRVHWRCIGLLQCTFEMVAGWFPEWVAIDVPIPDGGRAETEPNSSARFASVLGERLTVGATHLVSVRSFYGPGDRTPLPESWDTTSDSLAAWLAVLADAERLSLWKSCDVSPSASLAELAAAGVVDPVFTRVASSIPSVQVLSFAGRAGVPGPQEQRADRPQ